MKLLEFDFDNMKGIFRSVWIVWLDVWPRRVDWNL
jgi:hypothetical protein